MIRLIRFVRDLRLIPIAVIASACLLALKAVAIYLDRAMPPTSDSAALVDAEPRVVHAVPGVPQAGDSSRSWAQQMFNFPGGNAPPSPRIDLAPVPAAAPSDDESNADLVTGSIADKKAAKNDAGGKAEADAAKSGKPAEPGKDSQPARVGKANPNAPLPNGPVNLGDGKPLPSPAERALLERLSERRQELDKRARELDIREGLVAEAEKRVEARLAEIKAAEAQVASATEKKDAAEAARFKGLITMYENMKARDAAKIFDRLETDVLLEVASQINPRRMADILAQMSPDRAEKLTVELASRAKTAAKGPNADLPKIEGQPTAQ
jgi:flagellar motility protein MotE (MotC chaperone)